MNLFVKKKIFQSIICIASVSMFVVGCGKDKNNSYEQATYAAAFLLSQQDTTSTKTISTFAGSAGNSGSTDATGTEALFNQPDGIATDGTNLYVADSNNHTIRKIEITSGTVTTLAGSAGNSGSADGTGTAARFNKPIGIATDKTNLYVTDTNHTIRKIVISTGVVTTLAGTAGTTGSNDATGTSATFNSPNGITIDSDNTNLYVSDYGNNTIRKVVISTGVVTTLAGSAGSSGSTDDTGTSARFSGPAGITADSTQLYVADSKNHTIRKIEISTGAVTTLAGSAGATGSTDSSGTSARFNGPVGIVTDNTNLYVSDYSNNTIRQIVISSKTVTTLAGTAGESGTTDGTGTAARFNGPAGITIYNSIIYVSDSQNHTIRKIK
ncbi:MAG: hypothetical protein H7A23_06095 [Leptospiraceae bacterium]|nr:hypothetical protein [Leptospiraceae bacterium]MCP5494110.1 hypothetical protein [Leptospiraceae bacterium]